MIDSIPPEPKGVLHKLRKVKIDTYKENIAFLRRDCPVCASQGFNSQTKIEIGIDGKVVTAVLDVTEETFILAGEIGLCEYAFDKLGLPEGSMVAIRHPKPLTSYEHIKRKLDGYPFQLEHFQSIVRDIIADRYSKIEMTDVNLSLEALQEVVAKENGCIAWGGAIDLSPADDIIIQVERPLNIDSEGQMVASILAKKKSAGSTHVLVDMPLGPTSKLRSPLKAMRLRSLFEYVGEQLGLYIECTVSDGTQPIGRGIGPALEARDVLQVLHCEPLAPQDYGSHYQSSGHAKEPQLGKVFSRHCCNTSGISFGYRQL